MPQGQLLIFSEKLSILETFIDDLTTTHSSNIDEHNMIIIPEEERDILYQKKDEFFTDIIKLLSISVLCGEYIKIETLLSDLQEIESRIQELPNKTNDLPLNIQDQIFEISSAIIVLIENYKDFYNEVENYYSDNRVEFLLKRNNLIQKELNKENLKQETKRLILYFTNLLRISKIDHYPSTEDRYILEVFTAQSLLDNFSPSFRDLTSVINIKINFLKFKWKERRLQENPFIHSYLEDGEHKRIEDFTTENEKLKYWRDIINSQYELTASWKAVIRDRVKPYKNKLFENLENKLQIHQLLKYFKDVDVNGGKLSEISTFLFSKKSENENINFYDRYAESVFCNYSINNEFSNFIENEMSIEKINERFEIASSKIDDNTNNYFLKFKYLNKIFNILISKIDQIKKEEFISLYSPLLERCKNHLQSYQTNIEWSLKNFNYIFILPFHESLVKFTIDGREYDLFFASTFVLPPSSKNINDNFDEVKSKFLKLTAYLDFAKYFLGEITEINNVKKELELKEVKSIELISLFTAVISFIIGGVSGFAFIKDLYTALLFFIVFTTSLLTFLIVLFVFTRGKNIINEHKIFLRWIYGIFLFAIFVIGLSNFIKLKFFNTQTELDKIKEKLKIDSIKNSSTPIKVDAGSVLKIDSSNFFRKAIDTADKGKSTKEGPPTK